MLRAPLRSRRANVSNAAMEHTTTAKSRETAAVHNFFGNIGMRDAKRRCWNGDRGSNLIGRLERSAIIVTRLIHSCENFFLPSFGEREREK